MADVVEQRLGAQVRALWRHKRLTRFSSWCSWKSAAVFGLRDGEALPAPDGTCAPSLIPSEELSHYLKPASNYLLEPEAAAEELAARAG